MKKTTWLSVVFVAAVLGYLVISSFHTQPFRCRVCISFNGRRNCSTATSETREGAQRAATSAACSQIASGVSETGQCDNTPPDSVDWGQ
jgi:hypothetical protein